MTTFQQEIEQYDYRQIVVDIVNKMSTNDLRETIKSLEEDQVSDVVVQQKMCTVDQSRTNMVEFYCRTIWNWGWEGCDWFTRKNKHLLRK